MVKTNDEALVNDKCRALLIATYKTKEKNRSIAFFFDVLRVSTVNVWESMVMVQELAGAGERGNREMGMIDHDPGICQICQIFNGKSTLIAILSKYSFRAR